MTTRNKPKQIDLSQVVLEDEIPLEDQHYEAETQTAQPRNGALPTHKGNFLLSLFASALTILIGLAFWLWVDTLVNELFARADWLGWTATVLAAVALGIFILFIAYEVISLLRMRRITRIRQRADKARKTLTRDDALISFDDLNALYKARPDRARARKTLQSHRHDIIDGPVLLDLVEDEMLSDLDQRATQKISEAARRVSIVTAVSPRAIVDLLFVVWSAFALIRNISQIYGGSPRTLGTLVLIRKVISHLVITGSIAAGEALIQQLIGHGLAARLSAKLGEGVINGILTARLGIAAADLCRPMPYCKNAAPDLSKITSGLWKSDKNLSVES